MTSSSRKSQLGTSPPPLGPAEPYRPARDFTRGFDALPAGTQLGEFEIEGMLYETPCGIVYLANDPVLQRQVAIKEYLPLAWAARGHGSQVTLRSPANLPAFVQGQRAFINQAQALVRFDHPSLMRVYRCWEANRTAYMVTPYYEGRTLQQVREQMNKPPSEAWLRALLEPLLEALQLLHGAAVQHLNITPEHILLQPDGMPVLFDLGLRAPEGGGIGADKSLLNPAYAPIEQYAETEQLQVGPWTDLYSLAATVYFAISGSAPLPATARAVGDTQMPLAEMASRMGNGFIGARYSRGFLEAFDWALAVRPQDRPQRVTQLRQVLGSVMPAPPEMPVEEAPTAPLQGRAAEPPPGMYETWIAPPRASGATQAPAPRTPLSPRELGERLHATVTRATADVPERERTRPPRLGPLGRAAAEGPAVPPFEASILQALASAETSIEVDERNRQSRFGSEAAAASRLAAEVPDRTPAASAAIDPLAGMFVPESHLGVQQPRWRRHRPWWTRSWARWSGAAVVTVALAWVTAMLWQDQRLSERATDVMARALERQPEAPAPAPAPNSTVQPVQPAPQTVAPAAQPLPPTPAAQATAPAPAGAADAGGAALAGSGTSTQTDVPAPADEPPAAAAPPKKQGSSSKVASVTAGSKAGSRASRTAADQASATPRAACGNRVQFSLYYCMQTQCRKPQFRGHPQCRSLYERDAVVD